MVNDIYLKYVEPTADRKKIINISYASGVIMVIFGVGLGLFIKDVTWFLTSLPQDCTVVLFAQMC